MKLVFLGIIFLSVSLNAEIISEKTLFSSLCIEDDSTGFVWKNSQWKQTRFTTSKYLYKKIKSTSQYCKNTKIEISKWDKDDKYKTVVFSKGCYEVREFGSKYKRTEQCDELWYLHPNGKTELNFVRCMDVEFQPDGNFARSNNHTQFNNFDIFSKKRKTKDSLFVSHGKCSIL